MGYAAVDRAKQLILADFTPPGQGRPGIFRADRPAVLRASGAALAPPPGRGRRPLPLREGTVECRRTGIAEQRRDRVDAAVRVARLQRLIDPDPLPRVNCSRQSPLTSFSIINSLHFGFESAVGFLDDQSNRR